MPSSEPASTFHCPVSTGDRPVRHGRQDDLGAGCRASNPFRRWFCVNFPMQLPFQLLHCLAVSGMLYGAAGIATMGLVVGRLYLGQSGFGMDACPARRGGCSVRLREIHSSGERRLDLRSILLAGFSRPVQAFLGRLADAAVALGLIAVGAALRLDGDDAVRGASLWIAAVKLVALPLATLGLAQIYGLEGLNFRIAVLFAALPTASSAHILAMRMGGDGKSVAWLISATTWHRC